VLDAALRQPLQAQLDAAMADQAARAARLSR